MKKTIVYFLISILLLSVVNALTNFEECTNAGNPVTMSYPRTCRTSDGSIFTEEDFAQTSTTDIVTPDNPSYFMKVKVPEYFQLLFAKDKSLKHLEFMEKRRLEYEKLAFKFNTSLKSNQEKILEQLRSLESKRQDEQNFVEGQFSSLTNDKKLFVFEKLKKHKIKLVEVKEQLPVPAQQRLIVAIESSTMVIKKFNTTSENIKQFEMIKTSRGGLPKK